MTCKLFSKLYIGCQNRDGNLQELFAHENQSCPPSLSNDGQLRAGVKSDLLNCIEDSTSFQLTHPDVTVLVCDGPAIVHMLKPGTAKTFMQYYQKVLLPYVHQQM